MRGWLAATTALLLASAAHASPTDDLNRIVEDHWRWWLDQNPTSASVLGERNADGKLELLTPAAMDKAALDAEGFVQRLRALPERDLDQPERINKRILERLLTEQVEGNRYGQRQMLFTSYANWHQGFADLPARLPFEKGTDYASWRDRLAAYPAYNAMAMAVTREAIKAGQVQPCVALDGFGASIASIAAQKPESSDFYAPFTRPKPRDLDDKAWNALKAEALDLIAQKVLPAYRAWHDLYQQRYQPQCRKSVGASALPDGPAWYALQARIHTTTTLSPDEIHAIGLKEVARIGEQMDALSRAQGHADRKAMIAALHNDRASYATSPADLLRHAASIAKSIDGQLPRWFKTLPRLPYGIKAIPDAIAPMTTTAYYMSGSPGAAIAGQFYVNTSRLDQRPLWELPALAAHEAVPGHHLQIARQQELPLPQFRKHAAGFTAFVEGWGLYAEALGEEMGLYDTPPKMMGRLSYEMWRACRLVVDTGLHSKGWSKAQAIAYMREQTGLADGNIEAEVNRYISWPGQALGYKLGEIRIREARRRAETRLGTAFSLPAFHDLVLSLGAVPLDLLDEEVDRWISEQAR